MIAKLRRIASLQTRALPHRLMRPRVVFLTSQVPALQGLAPASVVDLGQSLFARFEFVGTELSSVSDTLREQVGYGAVFQWDRQRGKGERPRQGGRLPGPETEPLSGRSPEGEGSRAWASKIQPQVILSDAIALPTESPREGLPQRIWISTHGRTAEEIREQLYALPLRGSHRHLIHSLRITSLEHLPKKRAVAEFWCRTLAVLSATRAVLPAEVMTKRAHVRELLDHDADTFWQRRVRIAVASCYDLAEWEVPNSQSSAGRPPATELAWRVTKGAARALVSMRGFKFLAGRIPRMALRRMPKVAGAVAVVSFAWDARREHQVMRDFASALIARAEAEWVRRLSLASQENSKGSFSGDSSGPLSGSSERS